MRRWRLAGRIAIGLTLASGGLVAASCGSESPPTPVACLDGPQPFLAALERAPEPVQLGDGTRISECLRPDQPERHVREVEEALVSVATRLNNRARASPGGPSSVALGYLLGAVERGASETHANLVRRVEMLARFAPGPQDPPAELRDAIDRGAAAGREHG